MSLENHYRVLGLGPGSDLARVKKAYLREIKTWHPDRFAPDSILRAQAEERAKLLTAAYTALTAALRGVPSEGAEAGPTREADRAAAQSSASDREDGQARAPISQGAGGGEEWLGGVWQRLKRQWRSQGGEPRAGATPASPARSKAALASQRPQRRRSPRFEEVLQASRTHPRSGTPTVVRAASWRRLVEGRTGYRHRHRGAAAVEGIKARGPISPVAPVRSIRRIGDEG